ncbi:hypothetical protein ACFVWY_17690 [Streptomyces sp. NPDC058195]|uniref:hypothetical protein n=1 Tax=Streptomyces sp. NPDC058195 TaxID=3346375 RepID=UPI0036E2F588
MEVRSGQASAVGLGNVDGDVRHRFHEISTRPVREHERTGTGNTGKAERPGRRSGDRRSDRGRAAG